MSLGSHFPAGMAAASARRQLRPGAVVKFVATMDDGRQHEKRFVVLHVEGDVACCVMNTELHAFIARNPDLLRSQVLLPGSLPFVDHDSHLDCSRVRVYASDELVGQLEANPAWVLGNITTAIRDQIVAALKASRLISAEDCARYCDALEGADCTAEG